MTLHLLRIVAVLLVFIGTFLMIGSYEEHRHGSERTESIFMWAAFALFVVAAMLMGVG